MEIREAKLKDVKQIAIIMEQISRIHYENRPEIFKEKSKKEIEDDVIQTIKNKERTILVATDESLNICGVLIYKIKEVKNHINLKDSRTLWIDELGVDEKCRKKGIGKTLMKEVEKIAKSEECSRLELNCWNFNENAIMFYEWQGMVPQRRIMEKKLGGI